jgi:hypothetical protein
MESGRRSIFPDVLSCSKAYVYITNLMTRECTFRTVALRALISYNRLTANGSVSGGNSEGLSDSPTLAHAGMRR